MARMIIAGDAFNVEVEGDAQRPALMLSNSLGTDLSMWDAQMPALLQHFRVVRYDSRGHGKSVADGRPISMAQLGRDALAIMDALGLEKAHWMGVSKGGMVGQWLLTHAGARIGRCVLANTSSHMPGLDGWNARIAAVHAGGMAAITPAVLARWFTPGFMERAPETMVRIAAMLHATPPQGYANCCAAIRDMDQRESIRGVAHDVLVIVGAHDPATPPEHGALLAVSIKGARLLSLEAAHLSNIEDEAGFTGAVVDYLTAAPGRAR